MAAALHFTLRRRPLTTDALASLSDDLLSFSVIWPDQDHIPIVFHTQLSLPHAYSLTFNTFKSLGCRRWKGQEQT